MPELDEPEGVALVRAGWRYRRLQRLQQEIADAVKTRDEHIARVMGEYDRFIRDRQGEYRTLRAGFIDVQHRIVDGASLLPDEIELAGEWLAEIPPPTEPPAGGGQTLTAED